LNQLKILRIDGLAAVNKNARLSEFLGNAFRGSFGQALVRLFCKQKSPNCKECPCDSDCVYFRVFKVGELEAHEGGTIPNPYSLKVPYLERHDYSADKELPFSFLLYGSAADFADEVTAAICSMFQGKLSALTLHSISKSELVWSDEGEITPVNTLKLHIISPMQIMREKSPVAEPDFDVFIQTLFQRIAAIMDHFGEAELILPYNITHKIPLIETNFIVRAVAINQGNFSIKGILGDITFIGDLSRHMPYINLCTMLHVGKMTTRGCGEYVCEVIG
jgi:hypothetical protein